ncbi:MAG: dihydrofolate reductase [Burkholderiaceae bacterium]
MTETTPARLNLIYARARNGVIGKDNGLPWHLPEDLAHFKRTTLGCPVIMGRKTWDSLPPRFRPLPGRQNIVVTRDTAWQSEGATVAHSLDMARDLCPPGSDAWVIGGAQVYALALPLASRVVVTEIDHDFEGDAHAPHLGSEWQEVARESHVSADGLPFAFVTYDRQP